MHVTLVHVHVLPEHVADFVAATRPNHEGAVAGSSRTRPAPKTIRGSRATPNAASGPGALTGGRAGGP